MKIRVTVFVGLLVASLPALAAITITPTTLPTGQVGTAYSQTFTGLGGAAPYTFSISSGAFPTGTPPFAFAGAVLKGTPNGCNSFPGKLCPNPEEPMNSTFTITAKDSLGHTGSQAYTMSVYWNPTKATYETNLRGAMQTIAKQINGMPHPAIPITGQHIPGNFNWVNTGMTGTNVCDPAAAYGSPTACVFNNAQAMNLWTDAMIRVGLSGMELNLDPMALSAASQYKGPLPSDCPNGWWCKTLANYDSLISYAVQHGMTIKLRPIPGSAVRPCRLGATSTEANLEACYKPLFVAAALRWKSQISQLSIIHEAVGVWGIYLTPFVITVPIMHEFLTNTAAAIHTANPTLRVGAGAETSDPGDAPYFADYVTIPDLDYLETDLFVAACNVTDYPTTTMATAFSWASSAIASGKTIDIGAAARPPFLLANCMQASEADAIEAAGDIDWSGTNPRSGVDPAWLQTVIPAVSAYGYKNLAIFNTTTLVWYSSDHANARITGSYPTNVMAHISNTSQTGMYLAHIAK